MYKFLNEDVIDPQDSNLLSNILDLENDPRKIKKLSNNELALITDDKFRLDMKRTFLHGFDSKNSKYRETYDNFASKFMMNKDSYSLFNIVEDWLERKSNIKITDDRFKNEFAKIIDNIDTIKLDPNNNDDIGLLTVRHLKHKVIETFGDMNGNNFYVNRMHWKSEMDVLENLLFTTRGNPIKEEAYRRASIYMGKDIDEIRRLSGTNEIFNDEIVRVLKKNAGAPVPPPITQTSRTGNAGNTGTENVNQRTMNGQTPDIDSTTIPNGQTPKDEIKGHFTRAKQTVANLPIFKNLINAKKQQQPSQGQPQQNNQQSGQNSGGGGSGLRMGSMITAAGAVGTGAYGIYQYYQENKQVKAMMELVNQNNTRLMYNLSEKKKLIGTNQNNKECAKLYEFESALVEVSKEFIETNINLRPDKIAIGMFDDQLGPIGSIVAYFNAMATAFLARQKFFNNAAGSMINASQYRVLLVDEETALRLTFDRVIDLGKNEVAGLNQLSLNSTNLSTEQGGVINNLTNSVGNVFQGLKKAMPQSSHDFLRMMSDHRIISATAVVLTGGTLIYLAHKYWDDIKEVFSNFWAKMKNLVGIDNK